MLRNLKGTADHELHLAGGNNLQLECFMDPDRVGEIENRKSKLATSSSSVVDPLAG